MDAPGVDRALVLQIAVIAMLSVVVIAAAQMYVYSLSFVEFNSNGIVIENWTTLFTSKDASFEWVRVSRSVATRGGILGRVFDYGTIGIEETRRGARQARRVGPLRALRARRLG
jgi:hypothetical protein